jgi:hypothetical protein
MAVSGKNFDFSYSIMKNGMESSKQNFSAGYLGDSEFYVGGEMAMILPSTNYYDRPLNVYCAAIANQNWIIDFCGNSISNNIFYKDDVTLSYLSGDQFYAYDKDKYNVDEKSIGDTLIRIIYHDRIEEGDVNTAYAIFEGIMNAWGSANPYIDTYRLMWVPYVGNNLDIRGYSGEFDNGQAHSYDPEIDNRMSVEMIAHQFYHTYQAFETGISYNRNDRREQQMWIEGFNMFYCAIEESKHLPFEGYVRGDSVRLYKEKRPDMVAPMFSGESNPYTKGFICAFGIDKELRRLTNDEKTLDDVLRYFWNEHLNNGMDYSNEKMLEYLNSVTDDQFNEWWNTYLVNNEPIDISEIEHYHSYFEERIKLTAER